MDKPYSQNMQSAIVSIIRDEGDEPKDFTEEELQATAKQFNLTPEETDALRVIAQDGIGY